MNDPNKQGARTKMSEEKFRIECRVRGRPKRIIAGTLKDLLELIDSAFNDVQILTSITQTRVVLRTIPDRRVQAVFYLDPIKEKRNDAA